MFLNAIYRKGYRQGKLYEQWGTNQQCRHWAQSHLRCQKLLKIGSYLLLPLLPAAGDTKTHMQGSRKRQSEPSILSLKACFLLGMCFLQWKFSEGYS